MGFARFMASPAGRILRIVVGLVLVWYGFNGLGGGWGIALAAFGVIAVIAGTFNLCLIAGLIGAPFRGRDVLKAP
ncbi:MAG TPA: YgaP-like transmembrane domain [Myxococcaceae bacterium]|jgi:hypothetical protein|nr:YgaP-like transmembrane domain [Myxococcaceae bacterium]